MRSLNSAGLANTSKPSHSAVLANTVLHDSRWTTVSWERGDLYLLTEVKASPSTRIRPLLMESNRKEEKDFREKSLAIHCCDQGTFHK